MKLETRDLGGPVHFADFGGSGPPLVLVHGLGGSLSNWMTVGPQLSERFRVFALDLAGFGHTPLTGRTTSVEANVALVARFIKEVAGAPAIVVGNSMGGLIGAVLAASRPELVSRLILVCAALGRAPGAPLDGRVAALFAVYMTPFLGSFFLQYRAKTVGPERSVRETLRLCGLDVDKLPPEVFAAHLDVAHARLEMPWAHDAFIEAVRSLIKLTAQRRRFEDMLRKIKTPTLLIQGSRDRLVPLATAEHVARLRRDWTLVVLDGVGHVPQIEVPERWLSVVDGWLNGLERPENAAAAM